MTKMTRRARAFGWAAAGLTFVWFLVHTLVGGAEVAGPLRASGLPMEVMAPAWMVWHMVTVILLFTAGLFALATLRGDRAVMAVGVGLSACFAISGIAAAPLTGAGFALLPHGFLFLLTGGLGFVAVRQMPVL